jgi:outer membrane protein insertion porin family
MFHKLRASALSLAVLNALSVMPGLALSQTSQPGSTSATPSSGMPGSFTPFIVRDIQVEGVQRVEPGTVFNYLPVRIGQRLTEDLAAEAVKALFATGFFKDVRLEVKGDVLIVLLEERPAIGALEVSGSKEFEKDVLTKVLREQGLAEGRIFDRSILERAEQELKRQYLSRGKYGVKVVATVTPLERNRVGISVASEEGDNARIKAIRFVGNKAFSESQLLDQLSLATPNWSSWWTKRDQFSREKLLGDLETLRSYYLDRGYLEFSIEANQVSITPDKEDIEIVITIKEGDQFRFAEATFGGNLLGREEELKNAMLLKPGEVFNGTRLTESTKRMQEQFGLIGYAFANVNAVPEVDREQKIVKFNFLIDPGRRVYVRRINVSGNARTRDEVIRREMRQFEDSWYDSERIRASRARINRLGYFKEVNIETQPVPGAPDQVDLSVIVAERPTGNIQFGIGFGQTEKLILSAGINQTNFLGTGKQLNLDINTSKSFRTVSVAYTDPYFTDDGVSRTFDAYTRLYNAAALGLGDYTLRSNGIGLRFGVPYTNLDRVSFGLAYEQNKLNIGDSAPALYAKAYSDSKDGSTAAVLARLNWVRDTRDSAFAPTQGTFISAGAEVTLPVAEQRYARLTYNHQLYYPVSKGVTLLLNGDFGFGKGLGSSPYPVFKNFYAGGIGTVRGFQYGSLGGYDNVTITDFATKSLISSSDTPLGGQTRAIFNAELAFPLPGTGGDRNLRTFFFADIGQVFRTQQTTLTSRSGASTVVNGVTIPGATKIINGVNTPVDVTYTSSGGSGVLRSSIGFGISWISPVGPLKLSIAYPTKKDATDRLQRFQFQVGTGF